MGAGVTQVFAEPTGETRAYLKDHLKLLCHVPGPHCGGTPDEVASVVAWLKDATNHDLLRDEPALWIGLCSGLIPWPPSARRPPLAPGCSDAVRFASSRPHRQPHAVQW